MRRILRKISNNQHDQIGDVTTLADPAVVQHLIERGSFRFEVFEKSLEKVIVPI